MGTSRGLVASKRAKFTAARLAAHGIPATSRAGRPRVRTRPPADALSSKSCTPTETIMTTIIVMLMANNFTCAPALSERIYHMRRRLCRYDNERANCSLRHRIHRHAPSSRPLLSGSLAGASNSWKCPINQRPDTCSPFERDRLSLALYRLTTDQGVWILSHSFNLSLARRSDLAGSRETALDLLRPRQLQI